MSLLIPIGLVLAFLCSQKLQRLRGGWPEQFAKVDKEMLGVIKSKTVIISAILVGGSLLASAFVSYQTGGSYLLPILCFNGIFLATGFFGVFYVKKLAKRDIPKQIVKQLSLTYTSMVIGGHLMSLGLYFQLNGKTGDL